MGGGSWTKGAFDDYTRATYSVSSTAYAASNMGAQEIFKARFLDAALDPKNVLRECVDNDEHPQTFPVILALDVTGSMGDAAAKVAKALGTIMEDLYSSKAVPDIEFCVMAIGDLYCDSAPVQISQFESDIRIAEHLDKVYFEHGGGGNKWESYTAAWYMGARHCKLDCWNRGKRGVIITLGDEQLNPVLQADKLASFIGDKVQSDVKTPDLYNEASEGFDIHHISVNDQASSYRRNNSMNQVDQSWQAQLGQNYHVCTINELPGTITDIISQSYGKGECDTALPTDSIPSDGISW